MSQADFKKARKRLERAKQEMLWALAVLDDPSTNLKQYKLTQEEEEELIQECHMEVAEILTPLAQVLSKKAHITVESKTIKMAGPIPPGLARLVRTTSAPPESKPKRSSRRRQGRGPLKMVGPEGPIPEPLPEPSYEHIYEHTSRTEIDLVGPEGPIPGPAAVGPDGPVPRRASRPGPRRDNDDGNDSDSG